jgi:hypothetical protein
VSTLEEARKMAIEGGYTGAYPIDQDCVDEWPTAARCWWGRYGKCDDARRCLAQEFAMKDGSHKLPERRAGPKVGT